jgi:hypothetical protein
MGSKRLHCWDNQLVMADTTECRRAVPLLNVASSRGTQDVTLQYLQQWRARSSEETAHKLADATGLGPGAGENADRLADATGLGRSRAGEIADTLASDGGLGPPLRSHHSRACPVHRRITHPACKHEPRWYSFAPEPSPRRRDRPRSASR